MTTVQDVLNHLRDYKLKHSGGRNYHCNRPWSPNSDSMGLSITITPDGLLWADHVADEGGNLATLCAKLGLPAPNGVTHVPTTKRPYDSLADYARRHGVEPEVFERAGWVEGDYQGRPALSFPTATGTRYRFLDGESPRFINPKGYESCWYGLKRALKWADEQRRAVILVNGESTTVVAQSYGIPACCVTTGGERGIPPHLLSEFKSKWHGAVWVVMDCDDKGRRAADTIQGQLPEARVIDLGLTGGADLADFCTLYGKDAIHALADIAKETVGMEYTTVTLEQTVDDHLFRLDMENVIAGWPVMLPFTRLHPLGGFARVMMPGKVAGIVAPSAHGKTSFLETWADHFMKHGLCGLWFGPEWTPAEYQDRRIQRYGGPTCEQMMLWELWKKERESGVPAEHRTGEELPDKLERRAWDIDLDMKHWVGRCEYFESGMRKTLEATLMEMADNLRHRRNKGERVAWAVFDYAQLLRLLPENDTAGNRYESVVELVKAWTIENHIVTFIGSQVKKDVSKSAKQANKTIDSDSALYLRDDKFNLFITLNIQYQPDTSHPVWEEEAPLVKSNRAIANVSKNSLGRTGQVRLMTDFPHLTWLDREWDSEVPMPSRDLSAWSEL